MLNYIEITFQTEKLTIDEIEILTTYLTDIGYEGMAEEQNTLKSYIEEIKFNEHEVNELLANLPENFPKNYTIASILPKNWNEEWEKNYFQPIVIGNKCLIKSSFHTTNESAEYTILVDPKMSFGTGHHQTTSQMLETILELDINNKVVMDMGCGTGILGILCAMMGANQIDGIDYDPICYENCIENIELNNVSMRMILGDAMALNENKLPEYDIFLANINRNILLNDIKEYKKYIKNTGLLIVSGFYTEDFESIKNECNNNYLHYVSHSTKDNWVCATFKK